MFLYIYYPTLHKLSPAVSSGWYLYLYHSFTPRSHGADYWLLASITMWRRILTD